MEAVRQSLPLSRFEQLRFAREVLLVEGEALIGLAGRLHDEFCDAVELLMACPGSVVVTGMGKAGHIGRKITATLSSLGTRCQFLHPGEAVHGDLGGVRPGDAVLALSFSGETEELVRILPALRELPVPIVAITGNTQATLALSSTVVLHLGALCEACPHGLAPTTSTTAMLALGDALALVLGRMRNFGPLEFARNHPGGNLGRKLARVDEVMRRLTDCRIARDTQSIREVLVMASKPGRRTGAIMLVDETGKLTGLFTDSDLARLLERRRDDVLDTPIGGVMTVAPATIRSGSLMTLAVGLMVQRKISELPVVDDAGKPAGLVDITDVVAWLPSPPNGATSPNDADPADSSPKTLPFPNRFQRQSRK
jgi:arabinose-5-phosphate isomerase